MRGKDEVKSERLEAARRGEGKRSDGRVELWTLYERLNRALFPSDQRHAMRRLRKTAGKSDSVLAL